MKRILIAAALCIAPLTAMAEDVLAAWQADHTQVFDATDVDPKALIWQARALVVFGESPDDPQFLRQMDLLSARMDDLAERDVIIITDTNPDAPSALRLQLRPRAFSMVLISKDGRVALRKPAPWSIRELSRSIDKMPLRQQEISDRRLGRG